MNTSDTLDKIRELRLFGIFQAYKTNLELGKTEGYSVDQFLAMLIQAEYEDRQNRKINRLIDAARFRDKANIELINYQQDRNLDRTLIERLSECEFIEKHQNILITGPTGIGKSYIATALGYQACSLEYKVLYWSTQKLFTKLKQAKADNSYTKEIDKIGRTQLLIIDDFGLYPLERESRLMLMEIIEDLHGKASIIFTSQVPVKDWYSLIGEKTVSDAVMDRILQDAHRIEAEGESMRKTRPKKMDDFKI